MEAVTGMKYLVYMDDKVIEEVIVEIKDKNISTVVTDFDALVVKDLENAADKIIEEKKVEEKVNTNSAAENDLDVIGEKNNLVVIEENIEVTENWKKDVNEIVKVIFVNDKVIEDVNVEEKVNTNSAAENDLDVIGEKNNLVVIEENIEVTENVGKDVNGIVKVILLLIK